MDINDILSGLSESDMEQLKATAQEFFSSQNQSDSTAGDENDSVGDDCGSANNNGGGETPDLSQLLENAELLSKISSVMGAMNKQDKRSDLINALKPLLSEKRRQRADEAAHMIKLFDLLPMLQGGMGFGKR